MSLETDGVWKGGLWAPTVWADGVWAVGASVPSTTTLSTASDYGLFEIEESPVNVEKTPDEAITIEFPWAAQLDGATIASASYELPDGLTNEADSESGTLAQVRVSGGDELRVYRVISKITDSGGNDYEWVKRVRVIEG